jgi:hypothetical protein
LPRDLTVRILFTELLVCARISQSGVCGFPFLRRFGAIAAVSLAMLLLVANDARASAGCTAVNAGMFNLTDPNGSSVTASQAGFAVGDELTITYTAVSVWDSFVLSPSGGGTDLDNFHPSDVTTVRTHTLTSSQLSLTLTITNGYPYGTTVSSTVVCTPAPLPTVAAIAPNSGSTAGGTAVTITGTQFTGATSVTIGGAAATGMTVVNATTITATTPAHAAGAVDVVVTTPDGTGTGTGLFTYVAPPTVTAVNPVGGTTAGGTPVTITGTNLTGATAVTIGGVTATAATVVNATTITATTPAHAAGLVDVAVTTPGGTGTGTGLYTYASTPIVTALSPASGSPAGGTSVTITGANFTGATAVSIGGIPATGVAVVNATTVTATTPAHAAGAVDVSITTPGGTGTGTGVYTYASAPTVTAIDPSLGSPAGGAIVTITGSNLTGATAVTIGGAAATAMTVVNATTITVTAPAHAAGVVDVTIATPGGTGTGGGLYTYAALPTVTAVNPGGGPISGGTAITITGTGLDGASTVLIEGVAATNIAVVNDATITATTPAHAAGRVNVTVTTPGGSGTGTGLYTYRANLTLTSSPSAVTQVGEPYSQANVATGGTPDYRFSVVAGSLPAGTSLDASTGLVSGTPTTSGAFSYTIEVADSGAIPPTATQALTGVIAPIRTTTSLTSSLDPSLVGQPVTLTATVAPASATGTVTFKTDAATLCGAAPLANGIATCATTFAASGAYSVIAVYDGDATRGASASSALLQTVNDQRVETVAAIGTFISRRNDLIAANAPDAGGQIERLVEMGDFEGSVGSAGSRPGESGVSSTPGATRVLSQLWQAFGASAGGFAGASAPSPGQMALRLASAVTGPVRVSGNVDGATRFAAATSLRQVRGYEAAQNAGRGSAPSRPTPFDVWIDGQYASFRDDRTSADLDGHFRLVSIGSDYVLNRRFLVGGMVQFDTMRQRSLAQASLVSGHGWMAGPYATLRLADKLFWQGRAAWGRSTNDVSPFDTYTEHFGSTRWLLSSTLAGRLDVQRWLVRPAVSVVYVEDVARSYTDTFGVVIPQVRSGLGQAKVGPQVDRRYQISRRLALEPRAGLQLITTFGETTAAGGLGQIDGANAGPTGTRGRSEIGVNLITVSGLGIDLSGSYDGIGAGDYSALSGRVMVRVPFGP